MFSHVFVHIINQAEFFLRHSYQQYLPLSMIPMNQIPSSMKAAKKNLGSIRFLTQKLARLYFLVFHVDLDLNIVPGSLMEQFFIDFVVVQHLKLVRTSNNFLRLYSNLFSHNLMILKYFKLTKITCNIVIVFQFPSILQIKNHKQLLQRYLHVLH